MVWGRTWFLYFIYHNEYSMELNRPKAITKKAVRLPRSLLVYRREAEVLYCDVDHGAQQANIGVGYRVEDEIGPE